MFEPWEQRRAEANVTARFTKLAFRPVSEILKEVHPPSSEDRLEALLDGSWTPPLFEDATRAFLRDSTFRASLHRQGDALPALGPGVSLKYAGEYMAYVKEIGHKEDLVVAVVREGDRVIGFASAKIGDVEAEIKLLAVDDFSGRKRGVQLALEVAGETFTVGVGHILIDLLMTALLNRIVTDATTAQSRYIFKSLGFSEQPDTSNPCLLELEP